MVHVQSHEGPVMKLYLWDQAATDFCKKFKSYENTPTVLLVTAVNTKHLGVNHLTLWSHVFTNHCVMLGSNPEIAKQVSAEVVTKRETLTIADIFSYMTQESAKDAFFYFFVLLGDAGRDLTGRHASELVPVPEALISTIGQTHKFCVKVTDHNFSGNTRAIIVTKILPLDTPPPTEASLGNDIAATFEKTMQTGNDVCEPSKSCGDSADEESKRTFDSVDPEKVKRQRCEN
ncbi:BnaC02g23500D [Brassica napus]|uniref:BnaC02g23500D protein n=1 Tax=Brassica napus TaxID=3708 RepID=A0A078FKU6_BRANA|nr:BnaC02g23500D [Brassica napus]